MKKQRKRNYLKKIISMMLTLAMVTVMAGGFGARSVHAETVEGEEVTVTLTRSTATNMYINIQNRITWDNPNSINRKYSFSTRIRMLGGSLPTSTVITQSSFQSGDSGSWEFEAADSYRFVYRGYLYGDEVIPQGSSKTYIVEWRRSLTRPSAPFTYRGTVYSEKEMREVSWSNTYQPCVLRYDYTLFLKANDGTKIPLLTSYAYQTYLEYTQNFDITRLGLSEDTLDAPYSPGYPCIAIGWMDFEANYFRWSNVRPTNLMGGTNNRITDGISDPEGVIIGYAVNETRKDYATRQVGNATLATERTVTAESASPVYYSPIVDDKSSDLIASVGDDAKWTEDVEATWGKTTANKITSTSTATTEGGGDGMGTIVDDIILANGTDGDLANTDGTKFDKIGVKEHSYTIKDAHSLSSSSPYDGDNTSATTKRNIIVKTDARPALEAYYAGTSMPYDGKWLSQYKPGDETAPDASRFKSVDLKANGTGIAGTYDTVIWKGATGTGTEVERGTNTNTATYTFGAPGVETSADGQKFYANLQEVNNGTVAKNAGLTALSGNSGTKTVKIDSTPPTTNISVDTDSNNLYAGLTNSSSDELSGIDKTYVAFVEAGGAAPTITNGTWTEVDAVAEGTTYQAGKIYDIYAYSMDKATNKSAVMKLPGNPVTTPSIDISVEKHLKDTSIEKVQKGDELEYVIKVKNAGTAHATGYQIVDTLPAGLEYVSDDGGGTVNGQDVTWTKTIAAGFEMTITLKARVSDTVSAGAELKNRVVVKDENGDPVGGAEDESEEVEVKKPQAEVSKTADKDKVKLGDEITYTIKVENTGEVPVKDWTVTDTLGDGLTYDSDDASGTNSGQVTTWTVNLAVGETKEIKLVAKATDKDGAIKNGVEIRGSEPDDPATDEDESIEDEDDTESTLQFDVIFVDEDGTTVLKEKTAYDYKTAAADIAKPADPKKAATDKYVYVFKGWEPEVSDVTEDVVYKATYEEKKKYYLPKDKDDDEPVNPEDPFDEDGEEPEIGDTFIGEDGEEYKIIEIGEPDPNTGEIPIKVGRLFTLTFNLEGGELDGQTEAVKIKELKNETIIILGEPTREGYKFEYWQGSKYYPGDEYKVVDHHVFTAVWTKMPELIQEPTENNDTGNESNATIEKAKSKSAPTGDESNAMLWMILLALAAIGTLFMKKLRANVR